MHHGRHRCFDVHGADIHVRNTGAQGDILDKVGKPDGGAFSPANKSRRPEHCEFFVAPGRQGGSACYFACHKVYDRLKPEEA